jgi:hypothetical protein
MNPAEVVIGEIQGHRRAGITEGGAADSFPSTLN